MAIIYSYPLVTPELTDLIVGTKTNAQGSENPTKNFTLGDVADLVIENIEDITLTTSGPYGSATLIGKNLNIPTYVAPTVAFQSLETNGTSGAATLNNGVLNIPIYEGSGSTVSSVSATTTGTALNVTGSPITTEGTLEFTWVGSSLQYVNGAGGLTTFPTVPQGTVTSVGLSSNIDAFAVGSSPVSSSGTISLNLTGGTSGQFLRQDGNWATVPGTDLTGYQLKSEKGNANGYAPLDESNKVPTIHLPAAIVGSVIYQGTWDAGNNLPILGSPSGVKGYYYVVSNPGTHSNGIAYATGDWIISNGYNWQKVDNSAGVNSVNGATGTVVLNLADLNDVTGGTTTGQVLTRNSDNTYGFQTPASGTGNTDLTNTPSEIDVTVESSTGNPTPIAAASATIAGVMTAADKIKIDGIPEGGFPGTDLSIEYFDSSVILNSSTGDDTLFTNATQEQAGVMTAPDKIKLDKAIIGTTVDQTAIAEINTLTQASYDALVSAGTTSTNVMYVISSGNTPEPPQPPEPECIYTFTSNGDLVQAVNLWTGTLAQRDLAEDTYGHISNWCFTEGVSSMAQLFQYKSDFNDDISGWDVSSVRFMQNMFEGATSFNQNIGGWDVSSVGDMTWMFSNARAFNQDIGDWVVSSVTVMYNMFYYAQAFNNGYTYGTSDVENILNWDVSSVTSMKSMFNGAIAFNADLSSWNVSNVTVMEDMFEDASSFNQDLSVWCVQNIGSEPNDFSVNSSLTDANKPRWGFPCGDPVID